MWVRSGVWLVIFNSSFLIPHLLESGILTSTVMPGLSPQKARLSAGWRKGSRTLFLSARIGLSTAALSMDACEAPRRPLRALAVAAPYPGRWPWLASAGPSAAQQAEGEVRRRVRV